MKRETAVEAMRRYMESLPEEPTCREEISSSGLWRTLRAELLCTMLITVLACGIPYDQGAVQTALTFGSAVVVLRLSVAGAPHINPAVTVAFLVSHRITALRATLSVVVQCMGAVLGAAILYGLGAPGPSVPQLLPGVHPAQAFGVEFLATLIVAMAALACAAPQPPGAPLGIGPLYYGLAYFAAILFAFRFTGGCVNPARALGPALIRNMWRHHWVFWVGPILGGVIGGATYDYTQEGSRANQNPESAPRKEASEILNESAISSNETDFTISTSTDYRV